MIVVRELCGVGWVVRGVRLTFAFVCRHSVLGMEAWQGVGLSSHVLQQWEEPVCWLARQLLIMKDRD